MYRVCQQVSPVIHFPHKAMGAERISENLGQPTKQTNIWTHGVHNIFYESHAQLIATIFTETIYVGYTAFRIVRLSIVTVVMHRE
jgi:hypothetical protein